MKKVLYKCALVNRLFLFLLILLLTKNVTSVKAQSCIGLLIYSQADIDAFPINNPGCTEIAGSVVINAGYNTISNFNGFSQITKISGNLVIYGNLGVTNLIGFHNLTEITGDLVIDNNLNFQSLSGLTLTSVGGIDITQNSQLVSIGALNSITRDTVQYCRIQGNSDLNSLAGLESISYILNGLVVSNIPLISDFSPLNSIREIGSLSISSSGVNILDGLTNLRRIYGYLHLHGSGIDDLTSLNHLKSIGGFTLGETALTDFSGLDSLTHIGGNLDINNNDNLNSFNGLNNLISIEGRLILGNNLNLTSTLGLDNLQEVGGNIEVAYNNMNSFNGLDSLRRAGGLRVINTNITSLHGLENLNYIGYQLYLRDDLTDISQLSSLTIVRGGVFIGYTELTDLTGLENLVSIGDSVASTLGGLSIMYNSTLTDLNALSNVTDINGSILIKNNSVLPSLFGLENIDESGINNLFLTDNPALSICEIQNICNFVSIPSNNATVNGNAAGCISRTEIQSNCNSNCFVPGIVFRYQIEIDTFLNQHPNCSQIVGDVLIEEAVSGGITNLNGLSQITAIMGSLTIRNNSQLPNLSGLSNLTTIGDSLTIENNSIGNIDDLLNLTTIGGDLAVLSNPSMISIDGLLSISNLSGGVNISDNIQVTNLNSLIGLTSINGDLILSQNGLSSLTGLSNLTSVNGKLVVEGNAQLVNLLGLANLNSINGELVLENNDQQMSLAGIDSLDHTSISHLKIESSTQLSTCDVYSICQYLAINSNTATIQGNATGCALRTEVESECGIINAISNVKPTTTGIFPNPTTGRLKFNGTIPSEVLVYNTVGRLIKREVIKGSELNLSDVSNGIYFISFSNGHSNSKLKVVVNK